MNSSCSYQSLLYIYSRSSHEGASIGQTCGPILYGDALVMCEKNGRRELVKCTLEPLCKTVHFKMVLDIRQFNPCPAESGYTLLCKQCISRSVGF